MFELYKSEKTGQYHFRLRDNAGNIILTGEGYTAKASAQKGIESVKNNGGNDGRYECKDSSNGKHYFTLKSGNGQVVGQSKMHSTEDACKQNIQLVKDCCSGEVKDLTAA